MTKSPDQVYQIKVTLHGTHPLIWRRILVPGNTTLLKLHDILQIVMGWENAHLHMFKIKGSVYGDPIDEEDDDLGTIDEATVKLSHLIRREGQRLSYEYDFGDSWNHTLLVEKILPTQEGVRYPLCLKGKRACPPEDVGGVWGYQDFLEAIRNPDHGEHEEYLNWIGAEFDPEVFDLQKVNERLRHMGHGRSTEALQSWSMYANELSGIEINLNSPWPATLEDDQRAIAENLALRRDVIALLVYLRDHKVTGTPSTGNLPLKAVNEICIRFANPPKLEVNIGGHIYRARSESDVWPLYFRHVLASVGGLITGGLGRRWKLTPLGERFLAAPSPMQVWLLLMTWWTQTNWAITLSYLDDDYLPDGYSRLALEQLLDLPARKLVEYNRFADSMVKKAGMVWYSSNQDIARDILHSVIERTLINPLADFGVLENEYVPHELLGEEFQQLSSFQVTSFGKGLLEAINAAIET
jgi:Plasmid pRiA4b ORF-3-like protein